MKKFKSYLKWFFGISLILLLTLIALAWWYIRSEENQLSGANTSIVDASQFKTQFGKLAIKNINVLAADQDSILPNQTILINNELIEYVGEDNNIPHNYTIIDGEGKFLIPGLIDTHIHPYRSKNDLLLFLANGVTQVATMSSWRGLYLEWREEAKRGGLMPRMYVAAGPMNTANDFRSKVYGLLGPIPLFNDTAKTKKKVAEFKSLGYDGLKAYSLDKENYYAVSEASKKYNIPMTGHLTPAVGLEDLFRSNQSQVAHVEEIAKAVEREFGGRSKIFYDNTEAYLSFLKNNADSIARRIKDKNITISTTVNVYPRAKQQDLDLITYLKSIEIEYVNPGILEGSVFNPGWLPGSNRYEVAFNTDPEGVKNAEIYWSTYIEAVNIMTLALVRNGVTITAGTDAGNAGIVPGFSIHDELQHLSDIGIDNKYVLDAATKMAADWIGSNTGVIQGGKAADLVILNDNPLQDIRNTRNIYAVIVGGKYLDRNQLDEMLESVRYANNQSRKISIDSYLSK
ncbi:amidohydrolase family protein [Fulvivirga sedimenti]|uniref:Amidohydrolase family protein n=1 Tax=Fulvivirga sedimenti TaxID=2879465 RepID=A0A9X1HN84_9BACT|nr:amidohydrolase family protein [Fulvivirga sedimenti]MCA6075015.1 amidohydrolase family protein [Fulvivirga sedimenti]MCA6076192.1 amidohydrolase family protein [Fulvivirga sedimenti]MCA6077320.1 amidohydrolase family protein [Fulvivirga sedimenti]